MRVDACGPRAVCAVQGVARRLRDTGSVHTPVRRTWVGVVAGAEPALAFYPARTAVRLPETVSVSPPDTLMTAPPS